MKGKLIFSILMLILILFVNFGHCGETLVITPSRFEEKIVVSPYDTIVITGKELKERGVKTLDEALRDISGIFLTQNGVGGITSVFTRGLDAKYTVIMIDGVKVYDPSGTEEGDTHWIVPAISVENIDRIEIVKGTNTSLYGSNAVGGIINIITRKPKKNQVEVWSEIGSYDTFNKGGAVSFKKGNFFGHLSFSHIQIDDFSKKASDPDQDPYHNLNLSGKIGFQNEKIEAGLSTYLIRVKQNLDGWNYNERDRLENLQSSLKLAFSRKIKSSFKLGYTPTRREYDDGQDVYRGKLLSFEFQNRILFGKGIEGLIGFEYSKEAMDINDRWGTSLKKSTYNYAPFLSLILNLEKFYLKTGVRSNHHKISGSSLTADLSSYWFPCKFLKLYTNMGRGFVSPSLYQLFSSYGNRDLKPERSLSLTAGVSLYTFKNRVIWDFSYFTSKVKNKIEWDSSQNKYYNIGEINTRGYEASLTGKLHRSLDVMFYYDWLWAKDENGNELSRRPHIRTGARLNASFKHFSLTFEGTYVGSYKDGTHQMGKYFIANLYFSYQANQHFRIYGKVLNFFDRDYQEIYGYNTYKRSIWLGAEIKW